MLVKIKSTLAHRRNQTITLPEGLGEIKFGEDCIAEINSEVADKIIEMNLSGFELVESKTDEGTDLDDIDITEESLSKLKVLELQEVARQCGISDEEFKGKNKKDLISFILAKVSEDKDTSKVIPEETNLDKVTDEGTDKGEEKPQV